MIDFQALKLMTPEHVQEKMQELIDMTDEAHPIDTAGVLLVLWDDLGNMYFRGAIPSHIKSGESLRSIATSLEQHLGEA